MSDQNQIEKGPASRSRGRGCLLGLGAGLALLVVLLLVGSIYESRAEAADAVSYPAPGQLVDVGGYHLHLNCSGTGSPTVVIDAGWGDWSTAWADVQSEVARNTRVCTYDRAGIGWSEAGPQPRDAEQFAKELHTLLQNGRIPGPYIMAGHSLGGLPVRVFTGMYPSEIAGVVLMDSMTPQQFTKQPAKDQSQSGSQSQPASIPALLGRFGIVRLFAKPLGIMSAKTPAEKAAYSRLVLPQNLQAYISEGQGMPASGAEASAVQTFGDLPLIVLTAKLNDMPNWQERQTDLLQLSSNSLQLFAESDHNIQIEAPEAAIAALNQMIDQVR